MSYRHLHNICICEISLALRAARLILFILRWHLCLSDGFACSERRFYMSASQWVREVLWTILPVIQSCLWRFPFLLSRSRRWDHRTSLHRWQLRLKVSRSRGAFRLLARCEILPCMLCLHVPDPLLPWEMGFQGLPPGESLKFGVLLFFFSVSFQTGGIKTCKLPLALFFSSWGTWLSGISLSLLLMISYKCKSVIVAFDKPQRHNKKFSALCRFDHE